MAEEPQAGSIVEVTIGLGKTGATIEAPYSQYGPNGEEWSKLDHLIIADGLYEAAWSQVESQSLTIENNDGGTGLSNAQKVKWIYREPTSALSTTGITADIVVTTREIYVKQSNGTIVNMTPLYEEGTASCAGATTTVVGTGTNWSTHRIKAGMLMRFPSVSATWIPIATVGGNTSITLESNGPNTGGSIAYEIRRTFGGDAKVSLTGIQKNRVYCALRNGNLYVASNSGDGQNPAIIEVPDALENSALDPSNSRYILAQAALTTTHPATAIISTLGAILGMFLSDDGRVVIATHESAGTAVVRNKVRWSTPTAVDNWTTGDGAGFADIVGPGQTITGVGMVGGNPSFHFSRGITIGIPTGQLDVPYDFRDTQAQAGAACPEVLCQFYGGDLFVGHDLDLYVFNGSTATPVGGPTFQFEAFSLGHENQATTRTAALGAWACGYEGVTNSYHLFGNWVVSTTNQGCHHIQLEIPSETNPRRLYTFDWEVPISCLSWPVFTGRGFAFGFPSAFQETGGLADAEIISFRALPDRPRDANNDFDLPTLKSNQSAYFQPRARTNWIDFGYPGYIKRLRSVQVYALPAYALVDASPTSDISIVLESLPIEANRMDVESYPAPAEQVWEVSNISSITTANSPMAPVARSKMELDPLSGSGVTTYQSASGDSFRVSIVANDPGNEQLMGLYKVVLQAEIVGPIDAASAV